VRHTIDERRTKRTRRRQEQTRYKSKKAVKKNRASKPKIDEKAMRKTKSEE
jgi:hypothetical protein